MTDKVTLGVQFEPDAELLEEFEEYKEANGFTSRAETMRHLMREELHSDDTPAGVGAALSSVAGDEAQQQVTLLGRYLLYAGAALVLVDLGVLLAPVWIGMAAVFGFLAASTALAVTMTIGRALTRSSPSGEQVKA